ncbi:ATP-dependent DNA ligase [Nocardiopsis sp. L17-MgMaSL7]|uniref:ATP-dependent DNA ligase n=1 Tax=Nocardiopsis sp. L17-MgMaSL7 TaxID=1938893 RepID=UPI000D7156D3|nr:ATP-dependent DNA ligase [Nocardiopsis sp. L17-MgMaSL7]PWV44580.1 ATP-dependent DNA ligase [Nocardiopsis sp. L17-MgMaSL7]
MLATAVDQLPTGPGLLYEPKWDGFRCLAQTGPVRMSSKRDRPLHPRFPELVEVLDHQLPEGVLLDGEIIRWADDGRLDFGALLRRNGASTRRARALARAEPCHLVVFDLLRVGGRDLMGRALSHRRSELEHLLALVEQPSLLTLGWQSDNPEVALQWWEEMPAVGVEGVMIKDGRRSYRPGTRGWRKYKHRVTTEAIVGGVVGHARAPRALILGRVDSVTGELRVAGRTTDLSPQESEELAGHLVKTDDHPWPRTLAATWGDSSRQHYTQVVPEVVVEVSPDSAEVAGRWRHVVRYVRTRTDLRPGDVPQDLDAE